MRKKITFAFIYFVLFFIGINSFAQEKHPLYKSGTEKFLNKNFSAALYDLNNYLKVNPDDYDAQFLVAFCKYKVNDFSGALSDANRLIGLNSNVAQLYIIRSLSYIGLKDYKNALADCNKSFELKPDNASAYYCKGCIRFGLGDNLGALYELDKAIGLAPDFDDAKSTKYSVLLKLKPDETNKYYSDKFTYVYQNKFCSIKLPAAPFDSKEEKLNNGERAIVASIIEYDLVFMLECTKYTDRNSDPENFHLKESVNKILADKSNAIYNQNEAKYKNKYNGIKLYYSTKESMKTVTYLFEINTTVYALTVSMGKEFPYAAMVDFYINSLKINQY
jgi:hypothetical protein